MSVEAYEPEPSRDLARAPAPAPAPQSTASRTATAGGASGVTLSVSSTDAEAPAPAEAKEPEQKRLRIYTAELSLSVTSVEDSRDRIMLLARSFGGYVESAEGDYVVTRVPAESFEEAVSTVSDVGEVRSRSISAQDVTEQFADLEKRLAIAVAARNRLQTLLEQAEKPEERVAILRDIRRLTEEIEQLRGQLKSLDESIRFSRIGVRLLPRLVTTQATRSAIPFRWIARLEPLTQTTGHAESEIELEIDSAFAVFASSTRVRTESADGVRFRIGAVGNEPIGTSGFWQRALAYHLKPLYREVSHVEIGAFRGVSLESKGAESFYFIVAVTIRDSDILVAEAFFPNKSTYDKHIGKIEAMLEGVSL